MLTVVGEIVRSEVKSYNDRRTGRPAYRLEAPCSRPTARRCGCRSSPGTSTSADWQAGRLRGRPPRAVHRARSQPFQRPWQLTNPHDGAVRRRGEDGDAGGEAPRQGRCYPIYPLTKGVDSWDLQRAVAFALDLVDDLPDLLPDELREAVRPARRAAPRCDWIHAPDDYGQVAAAQTPVPLRGGAGHPAGAGPAPRGAARARARQARTGDQGGLLAAFDARLPFELTGGQREIGEEIEARARPAAPDEPPAAGRGRLRQDRWSRCGPCCASSTPAARRRCSPRPRCSPSSTTARSPRCSATSPPAGMLGGADGGTPVALLTGSMTKAAARRADAADAPAARPAS